MANGAEAKASREPTKTELAIAISTLKERVEALESGYVKRVTPCSCHPDSEGRHNRECPMNPNNM